MEAENPNGIVHSSICQIIRGRSGSIFRGRNHGAIHNMSKLMQNHWFLSIIALASTGGSAVADFGTES